MIKLELFSDERLVKIVSLYQQILAKNHVNQMKHGQFRGMAEGISGGT